MECSDQWNVLISMICKSKVRMELIFVTDNTEAEQK